MRSGGGGLHVVADVGIEIDSRNATAPASGRPDRGSPSAERFTSHRRRRRLTGDTLVARLLISVGIVLTGVLSLSLWQAREAIVESRNVASAREVEMTARALAMATESLAARDALSELRRLVVDVASGREGTGRAAGPTASQITFEEVSISLPDGSILAHSEPSRINQRAIPARWSAGPAPVSPPSGIQVCEVVSLPGRGPLHVIVRAASPAFLYSQETWVFSMICAGIAGVGGLFLVYCSVRKRLHTLSLISEALSDVASTSTDINNLRLDERFGVEARAFNAILSRINSPQPSRQDDSPRSVVAPARSDLDDAVHLLPVGVLILDRSGRVSQANNLGATLAGSRHAGVTGLALDELLPDEAVAGLCADIRANRAARRVFELRRSSTLGETVLRVQCRPLRRDDGAAALITLEDVSQQRLADASRNLFIAQATHELRTPLTNMRLAVEMVMEEQIPEEITPHLNMLSSEVRRLERLVSDMLAVSEIEAGSLKLTRCEIQVDRLISDIEADLRPQAEKKNINFRIILPPKLPQLFGDREKLFQAVHNLVGNAVKYTPESGSVTLTLGFDPRGVMFTVADTGFGISQEDQARLFLRFSRGTDSRVAKIAGTGLGLALSREIARLHGGDITLATEPDKGSTFTLIVPQGRSDLQSNPNHSAPQPAQAA